PPHARSVRVPLFVFNATAPTAIYTLSLHDALPISERVVRSVEVVVDRLGDTDDVDAAVVELAGHTEGVLAADRDECVHAQAGHRSEEHTSELQSRFDLVCRLLLEKKKKQEKDHSER